MSMQVIGSGFGRTATASLKIALEKLLGAPCYHMSEVLGRAGHVDLWLEASAGRPVWDSIFEGYAATVDFPGANYWRELSEFYPDAKIVHSVRETDRWIRSTRETIFSKTMQDFQKDTKWGRMAKATIDDHLGGDLCDVDALKAAFENHTAAVKAAFGPDRLLVFEAKQGWEPLCKFLDVPVPDGPYPNVNSKEEFENVFALLGSPMGKKMMNGEGAETASVHNDMFEDKA